MIVELNEKDLNAIRGILKCINEDTDLSIGVDSRKEKLQNLKDRVIDAWYDCADSVKHEGEFNAIQLYEKQWNTKFKKSNRIDMLEFYKCLMCGDEVFWVRAEDEVEGLPGFKVARKIHDVYYFDSKTDVYTMADFNEGYESGNLVDAYNAYLRDVGYGNDVEFDRSEEPILELCHLVFKNPSNKNVLNSAIKVLAIGKKVREKIYRTFLDNVNSDTIYRYLYIDYKKIQNFSQEASVGLESTGEAWVWSTDTILDGNCELRAHNDKSNIDVTTTALCLGQQTAIIPGFDEFYGEQEVRVLDETKVDVFDVKFSNALKI